MKNLDELLIEIDALKAELESLKPFKKEDEERLWKKFRLEWNYNSNHIEGNTLTYGQTELLLIFDKTTGDHEMREYEEMKAHDVAIKLVQEYAADKTRELTEADIRQLNEIILVRPYWGNAQTADGQQTRKPIQPGVYKREPNSVLLQNGEMFHYASPEETPAKMKELMDWYRTTSKDNSLHPVLVAAKMHYDFVRIHPFDDSNGRTSRLLMNYVLLRNGYPPVIIKSADKKNYLLALNKADVGDFEAFVMYTANELYWSLNKHIDAGYGQDLEDEDDLYKEIEVFKRQSKGELNKAVPKSREIMIDLAGGSLGRLFETLLNDQSKLDDFFVENRINVVLDSFVNEAKSMHDFVSFVMKRLDDSNFNLQPSFINKLSFQFYRSSRKVSPVDNSNLHKSVDIFFNALNYEVKFESIRILKDYPLQLSDQEIKDLSKKLLADSYESIKNPRKK
jgi:Fic family protein